VIRLGQPRTFLFELTSVYIFPCAELEYGKTAAVPVHARVPGDDTGLTRHLDAPEIRFEGSAASPPMQRSDGHAVSTLPRRSIHPSWLDVSEPLAHQRRATAANRWLPLAQTFLGFRSHHPGLVAQARATNKDNR
jgi:hypothetical protein